MSWRTNIAKLIAPEVFNELAEKKENLDERVNQRVADVLLKMDPFEPLMRKYNVVFSEEWQHPEDKLDHMGKLSLVMWAHGLKKDPNFKHLVDWIRNTQGNNTIRVAKNDHEWLYGRAAIATITLLVDEIGRLSSRYEDMIEQRDSNFDAHLPVGE